MMTVFLSFLFWQISDAFLFTPVTIAILLFVLMIVWTIYKMIRGNRDRKKRLAELQTFAAHKGWTFAPRASNEAFQNYRHYAILNHYGKIDYLLHRAHDGGTAMVFDFTYRERRGKVVHYYGQTVVAFHTPRLNVPFFALARETFGSRLGEMFGYRDIDFYTHPGFSELFHLAGADEMQIRRVFQPPVLDFLEQIPGVQIDAGGNMMFVYFHSRTVEVESLEAFLNAALNIYRLFRS